MQLSEIFWVGFYTSLMGFILALGNMFYKSKCKEVKCCCLKIIRDVDVEEKEFELTTEKKANI